MDRDQRHAAFTRGEAAVMAKPTPRAEAPRVDAVAAARNVTVRIPDVPTTLDKAYVAGWDASRRGDDLVVVVYAALRSWPLDEGLGELAELITSASYGYHTAEGGAR
jgi:hypothetical protein